MQDTVCQVRVEESLLEYAERVIAETRRSPPFSLGCRRVAFSRGSERRKRVRCPNIATLRAR